MTSSGATRILLFARHCTTPPLSFCRPEKPLLTAINCLSHAASSFVWSQTRLNPRLSQKPIKFANYSLIVRAFHAFRNGLKRLRRLSNWLQLIENQLGSIPTRRGEFGLGLSFPLPPKKRKLRSSSDDDAGTNLPQFIGLIFHIKSRLFSVPNRDYVGVLSPMPRTECANLRNASFVSARFFCVSSSACCKLSAHREWKFVVFLCNLRLCCYSWRLMYEAGARSATGKPRKQTKKD